MEIKNLDGSNDSRLMQNLLASAAKNLSAGDAGTVMRFATAFLAVQEGREVVLSGSGRMHQRPIGILVEALRQLGAEIDYLENDGFPPLRIRGRKLAGGRISIDPSVSSQFISALMMIGPAMENGLQLEMKGLSVSAPYIYLTGNIMERMGFRLSITSNLVQVENFVPKPLPQFEVEPDWSAASYWYLMGLLAEKAEIFLPGLRQVSHQGDAFVKGLFQPLGLNSFFIGAGYRLRKSARSLTSLEQDLLHHPDLAQTLAVACAALDVPAKITGLQTLRIKETDRLQALQTELKKTGADIVIGDDFLEVRCGIQSLADVEFETYDDHRMAMALAPLALLAPISIRDPEVVKKSYEGFWKDLQQFGFTVQHQ